MNKHTQGEWEILHISGGIFVTHDSGVQICKMYSGSKNFPVDEVKTLANAQLIANAPRTKAEHGKMLDVLKRTEIILSELNRDLAIGFEDYEKDLSDIQSLIAEIEK